MPLLYLKRPVLKYKRTSVTAMRKYYNWQTDPISVLKINSLRRVADDFLPSHVYFFISFLNLYIVALAWHAFVSTHARLSFLDI